MKRSHVMMVGIAILAIIFFLQTQTQLPRRDQSPETMTAGPPNLPCRSDIFQGVYEPSRFIVKSRCAEAVGIVMKVAKERDGDYHIEVDLAPQYRYMLNAGNLERVHGRLIVEIVPDDQCCVLIPRVGMMIRMVGAWVIDTAHGWAELHPAWSSGRQRVGPESISRTFCP